MSLSRIAKILGVSSRSVRRALIEAGITLEIVRKGNLIKQMYQLAKRRGGKCLSKAYINNSTKLLWQCEQGHQWEAKPNNIKTGYWCPYCAGNAKGTLEDMQQLAKDHGGKCLSKEYINTSTKLLWECKQGHQ